MPKQVVRSELLIGGAWVDVTTRTEGGDRIAINDGANSESTFLTSGTCRFTINNRDGQFSSDNPNSTYYGKLGRNTQFRTGLIQAKYIRMTGTYNSQGTYDNAHIGLADKASLDITGDIDIRLDVAPEDWHGSEPQFLATKYTSAGTNQRSWYTYVDSYGRIGIGWSTDGTFATTSAARSNPVTVSTQGRLSVRITLDVDNGAGGWTASFYTSDSITGTWTLVSQLVTNAGTTSIFASTTPLNIGTLESGGVTNYVPMTGKIYGMELRNGIGGTLVAKLDASVAARGATSVVDAVANTWLCSGSALVDDMDYRFWGEVNRLPQRWDETGRDVYVPVLAQDILSRLMSGAKQLESPVYRNLSRFVDPTISGDGAAAAQQTGWWPMETDSAGLLSAVKGVTGNYSLAAVSDWTALPGVKAGLLFSDDTGSASGNAKTVTSYYGGGGFPITGSVFHFQLPSIPVSDKVIMTWRMSAGDMRRVELIAGTTSYTLRAFSYDNVQIGTSTVLFGSAPTNPTAMMFSINAVGATVYNFEWRWTTVGMTSVFTSPFIMSNAPYTSLSPITGWSSPGFGGKSGMRLGQVMINQGTTIDFTAYNYYQSINAYLGEPALARFERLFREQGVQYYTRGISLTSPAMGAQGVDTLIDLAKECLDVVGGLLYAPRDKFGVTMRSLQGMSGRATGAVVLDYTADVLSPSLEPERVSTGITNAVTASRPAGGTRQNIKLTGPLNINDPATDPQGAGRYDSPISRNVANDGWLQSQADWQVAIGTEDSNRYAAVTVQLDRPEFTATLLDQIASTSLGDVFALRNLPIWMGKGDVPLMIRGRNETIDNFTRTITFSAAPYGPYNWGQYYYTGNTARYDSSATTLAAGITSSATTARFALGTAQTRWGRLNTPYDVKIGGQRNTVLEVGDKGALGADLGGFEITAANWQGGTGAPALSTAQAKFGSRSGLVTVSGSPASFTVRPTSSSVMALTTPGLDYTLSVWVYSSIALTSNFGGGITWYLGASSVSTSTATAITAPANTWTRLTFTATAPALTDRASYGPTITGSPANGTLVYFDAIELTGADVSFQPVVMTRGVDGITKALNTGDSVRVVNTVNYGRI